MTVLQTKPSQKAGKIVLTQGIHNWLLTGLEPYELEAKSDALTLEWRRHYIAVILTSHLSGDQGDTCPEDHALNREVYENPGSGGRLLTVWERNHTAKIFCITDRYGCANAVTTVLFASEY